MKKVSIVIPAYNEEKAIEHTLNEIIVTLKNINIDYEIQWQVIILLIKDKKPSLPESINNDYSKTNATSRILGAIDEKILSLKLKIHVNGETQEN